MAQSGSSLPQTAFPSRKDRPVRIASRHSDSSESLENERSVGQFGAAENTRKNERRRRASTIKNTTGGQFDFGPIIAAFDWRSTVNEYLFRTKTMEDYFCEYLHALGFYREKIVDDVGAVAKRLVIYSSSVPEDMAEIMPPSISGLVYNQSRGMRSKEGGENGAKKVFNIRDIVRCSKLFKFDDEADTIQYLHPMTKSEAGAKLREIVVKGTFIYFFAKFGHGQRFAIKPTFYQRYEPVRSVLRLLTSRHSIQDVLNTYFEIYSEVFEMQGGDLTLKVDYFSQKYMRAVKRDLARRAILAIPTASPPDVVSDGMSEDSDRSGLESGSDGEIAAGRATAVDYSMRICCKSIIDSFLVEPDHAETKSHNHISVSSLPFAVRSTICFVMDDIDSNDLLVTNPSVIDDVINRLEQQLGNVSVQRHDFKKEFEEEIRTSLLLKIMSRIE